MGISLSWRLQSERIEPQLEVDAQLLFETAPEVEQPSDEATDWIWRPVLWATVTLLFFGALFAAFERYLTWLDRPVETVYIEGATRHIDKENMKMRVESELDASLLEVDLRAIQNQLATDPWVNEVSVRRVWPPALEVSLTEEVPVARWGDRGLLNHQGDIFWPEIKPEYQPLPRLMGPSHETVRIMQQFHDLNSLFAPFGLHLVGLELEARGAWNLELDNGLRVVAGREDLMPRLRRFIRVYEAQLIDRVADIEQIDIRYTNGVAVRWKQAEASAKQG